jgi:hypothetical protein
MPDGKTFSSPNVPSPSSSSPNIMRSIDFNRQGYAVVLGITRFYYF